MQSDELSGLASVLSDVAPVIRSELTRLQLVCSLAEALGRNTVANANAVERLLRWSTIALPPAILAVLGSRARLARRYGFSDLYVVREEWNRYVASEIAFIENIMPKEVRKRIHISVDETETQTTLETDTTRNEETDSQTSDRLELSQNAQTETNLAANIQAQVNTDGQYGPVHVSTQLGGGFSYSQKETDTRATQQAHEVVSRAVKRVEEQIKSVRTTRSLTRITEKNIHGFNNQDPTNVVGMYRWVDKIQRLQMFRYRHRLLLEFQVPEPAAVLRWRRQQPTSNFVTPDPTPLVKRNADWSTALDANDRPQALSPLDISETNYEWWVAQYGVVGVIPPPVPTILSSAVVELKQQTAPTSFDVSDVDNSKYDLVAGGGTEGVAVPDGYRLQSWRASAVSYPVRASVADDAPELSPTFELIVGDSYMGMDVVVQNGLWTASSPPIAASSPALTGTIPVSVQAHAAREFRVHLTMQCARLPETLLKWQQTAFETISAAYWAMKRQHQNEMANADSGRLSIGGDSTARNQEVIRDEVKRCVIEMLLGNQFDGRPAVNQEDEHDRPRLNLDTASLVTPQISFLEQAFEWENLSYVFYPYYWADSQKWKDLADIESTDADFDRFLRAGSARVVVPARPNFENQVMAFVDFGVIWGGGPVPTVADPEYLSIAEEIRSLQQPPRDGEKGESWETTLPTTLIWLDDHPTLPKVNSEAKLDPPPA